MSDIRKHNRDVNLQLNRILNTNGILLEARKTSPSGKWQIVLGKQQFKGMPAWVVLCVRSIDWHFELFRWTVDEQDTTLFEDARAKAYNGAREKYELIVQTLEDAAHNPVATDEDSGMEVIEPDGEKHDYVN